MPDYIDFSICLSDIPQSKIKKDKNGKLYVSVTAARMKQEDNYKNQYTLYVKQAKEEPRSERVYLGKGKVFYFKPQTPTTDVIERMPNALPDDLPY